MIVHLLLAAWPVRSGLIPLLPGPVAAAASAPAGWSTIVAIIVGSTLIGTLNGMKWPVIESYVSAGQSPEMQARSVGVFNLSWSVPVVLSLLAIGPLVGYWPAGLFLVPAAMNALALAMSLAVPERPATWRAWPRRRWSGSRRCWRRIDGSCWRATRRCSCWPR
jgi:hypothetical protein